MKTIIFDIDGTITNMWPIEKLVLLSLLNKKRETDIENSYQSGMRDTYKIFLAISKKKTNKVNYQKFYNQKFMLLENKRQLPKPEKYPAVDFILRNKTRYHFLFVTGGQDKETRYVLKRLGIYEIFDLANSLNKNNYRFSKSTGLPFKKIKKEFLDCLLISDSQSDCDGAKKAGMPFIIIKPPKPYCP